MRPFFEIVILCSAVWSSGEDENTGDFSLPWAMTSLPRWGLLFNSKFLFYVVLSLLSNLGKAALLWYKADATFYVSFSLLRSFLLLLYTGKCNEPTLLRLTDLGVSLFFGGKWKKVKLLSCGLKANKKGQWIVTGGLLLLQLSGQWLQRPDCRYKPLISWKTGRQEVPSFRVVLFTTE